MFSFSLRKPLLPLLLLVFTMTATAQIGVDIDTVKAGRFDTGKMWTFDFPPTDYFTEEYGFTPDQEWYDNARMAALRFATYCTASFVSEDGLVMTNNHCARQTVVQVTMEGENLLRNGFYAETLEDERPVPGLFVDQLVEIHDVTEEIQTAIDDAESEEAKLTARDEKIAELEKNIEEEYGLRGQVITFFNGGKYSLYGYKRYDDVRLVLVPDHDVGFFGGDYDNFTYPRYNMDYAFYRVYDENGEPLKTEHYYKWSPEGPEEDEPIFVVGNPGSTYRLHPMSVLEYMRDYSIPRILKMYGNASEYYGKLVEMYPEQAAANSTWQMRFSNSVKAYGGILEGLHDPVLMKKKEDFEENFKAQVMADPELKEKYGHLWDEIAKIRAEKSSFYNERQAYTLSEYIFPEYYYIAQDAVAYAKQMEMDEDDRAPEYTGDALEETVEGLYPEDIDHEAQHILLDYNIDFLTFLLGEEHELVTALKNAKETAVVLEAEKFNELIEEGPEAILTSNDPFITYILATQDKVKELDARFEELDAKEEDLTEPLGRAMFDLYGTTIPPDATFSLRIADGVVAGHEYNGTISPWFTTFYGMYDRYHSFKGEFPWSLTETWQNPPAEFDLATPCNFVSTNDIIGGNSGSAVINKELEVVGLAFDGNMESLPGAFIFDTTYNRTVSVHSEAIIETIQDVYKITRISEELKNGKIVE